MGYLALSTDYVFWQDLLFALKQRGIVATHALAHGIEKELQTCRFYSENKTSLIEGYDFYRFKDIQKHIPANAPELDSKILSYFEKLERDFYIITDRYSFFPVSFRHRKRLLRLNIKFWLSFFKANKFDGVISTCTPHNVPEYVAYHVAQYLGLKTVVPQNVMIDDHVLIQEDYRKRSNIPDDYLADKSEEEIKALIRPELLTKTFKESNYITLSRVLNDKALGLTGLNSPLIQRYVPPKKNKKSNLFFRNPFEPKFRSALAMNGLYRIMALRLLRVIDARRLKQLKKDYESLAITPNLETKFIYFAMNLQPERTTQPEAELFEDHLLAIEILSKAAPDHLIYVKENPTQYNKTRNMLNGRHFRNLSDYLDMTRHKNVRLISQNTKSMDLVKKAEFVSSIKGSVGWEALSSGRPCMVFAKAWYSAHPSCFEVDSVESCKDALSKMKNISQEDVFASTLKFLAYMQDEIITGCMGGHHDLRITNMDYNVLINSMADKYERLLKAS